MSFFVRISGSTLPGGGFPFGTSVAYYTATYVSGPSTLPARTIYNITESLAYDSPTPGSYTVSIQSYSALGVSLGSAVSLSFTVPTILQPIFVATGLKIVGNPGGAGSGQGSGLIDWRPFGNYATSEVWGSCLITLSGPTTATATITTQLQQYVNFTGLANGNYTATFQNYDTGSNSIGPAANSPNRFLYYDETLDTVPIMLPTVVKSVTAMPESTGLTTSPV